MQIAERLQLLAEDLDGLAPTQRCPWHFGETFNQLLEQAKAAVPDDPIVSGMKPVAETGMGFVDDTSAALRSRARQVRQALIEAEPKRPRSASIKTRSLLTEPM